MTLKNYTFALILFFLSLEFQAQIVNIPDANFKDALLNHYSPIIDTNEDGEIQVSEAESLNGALDISNSNISDLTGLEAFTNITELNCEYNSITSLDLTSNLGLIDVFCRDNQLTYVDISENALLEVFFAQNNFLTSVDLSENTALQQLTLVNNQLTSIDVSNNANLGTLSLATNNLSSVDVSNNPMLSGMTISNNQLTTLDISANPVFTILMCDNNQLTSLNVANGNNAAMFLFNATLNSSLTCIQVDSGYTPPAIWQKDATAEFSDDCESLSTTSNQLQNLIIYPNPVKDILYIESLDQPQNITIYNLTGKQVLTKSQSNSVDMSQLSKGMYVAHVQTAKGSLYQKIMKN